MPSNKEFLKKCPKCGITKPSLCFGKSKDRNDGRQAHCKACRSQSAKVTREARGDEINELRRNKRMEKSPKWQSVIAITKQRDDLLAALEDVTAELAQLHSHYHPACEGGCPTVEYIMRARKVTLKASGG